MDSDPLLGILITSLGGLLGGGFYVPLTQVKRWAWETHWLSMGVVAWVIVPVLAAWMTVPKPLMVLDGSPRQSIVLAYLFGAMWGIGAVTFGLAVRYLGISLGMAVVVGLCAAFGTLVPPIVDGQLIQLLTTTSGLMVLVGVAVCIVGIAICGWAGVLKERELTDREKQEGVKEFALIKGFVVATVSGVTSSCMVYGINAGRSISEVAVEFGTASVYKNNLSLVLVLAGGFTVNTAYCLFLNIRNRTVREYINQPAMVLLVNYALVALAGILWYGQITLYGMGTTKMGDYAFTSWSIITGFSVTFSTICGLLLKEWKGVSRRTLATLWAGILTLVLSTVVLTVGNTMNKVL